MTHEATETIEFTKEKSVFCFMSDGNLFVEGEELTVHKSFLYGKESNKIENALALRNPSGKEDYYYRFSYTTEESKQFTIYFTPA